MCTRPTRPPHGGLSTSEVWCILLQVVVMSKRSAQYTKTLYLTPTLDGKNLWKQIFLLRQTAINWHKTMPALKTKLKFWRWIPRLLRRWRTQRSAIVIANCRIQWIIKISNAVCDQGLLLWLCLLDMHTPQETSLFFWTCAFLTFTRFFSAVIALLVRMCTSF